MSIMKDSMCNFLTEDFYNKMSQFKQAQKDIAKSLKDIANDVKNLEPSKDPFGLEQALKNAEAAAKSLIPNLSDPIGLSNAIDDINDVINACSYFNSLPTLSDPNIMLGMLTDKLIESVSSSTFDAISLLEFPELGVGKKLSELADKFEKLSLQTSVPQLLGMLNCMNSVCGIDTSSLVAEISAVQAGSFIDNTGKFDNVGMLLSTGADQEVLKGVKKAASSVSDTNKAAKDQVAAATGISTSGAVIVPPVFVILAGVVWIRTRVIDSLIAEVYPTVNIIADLTLGISESLSSSISITSLDTTCELTIGYSETLSSIVSPTLSVIGNLNFDIQAMNSTNSISFNIIGNLNVRISEVLIGIVSITSGASAVLDVV